MAQYSPRFRQQKVALFTFVAATASFAIGVMLPVNLRIERAIKQSLAPSSLQPQRIVPKIAQSSAPEATPQPLSALQFNIDKAIAQRVDNVQKTLEKLETQRFNYRIPEKFQGRTLKEVTIPGDEKVIALTFDDGPWPKSTRQILAILKENNIKATFFWVGSALNNQKDIAKEVVNEGHIVAHHSWSHRYQKYSPTSAAREIEKTAELMEELTGIETPIFRPPGGVLDNGLVDYVFQKNFVNILWSVDSQDWKSSSEKIINNVLKQSKSGGIVLMHDGGGNRSATVKALPTIIKKLKEQGYTFATIPELLERAAQEPSEQSQPIETNQP